MQGWIDPEFAMRLTAIAQVACERDLFAAVDETARSCGFDRWTWHTPRSGHGKSYWLSSYPREWVARYSERNYIAADPVIQQAGLNGRPFLWDEAASQSTGSRLALRIHGEAREFGLRFGATLPFAGVGGISTWNLAADVGYEEGMARWRSALGVLTSAGVVIHSRLAAQDTWPPFSRSADRVRPSLSDRQRQVLSLLSQGFQIPEIAYRLGIGERTAYEHVGAAKRALGAATMPQAVAVAIRFDLI